MLKWPLQVETTDTDLLNRDAQNIIKLAKMLELGVNIKHFFFIIMKLF